MKTVIAVMLKELTDLMRDRKTVMLSLFMGPVLLPLLLLGVGHLAEKRATTQLESTLKLPVVGAQHAPNLVAYIGTHNIEVLPAPEDPDLEVREQNHDVILRIPEGYPDQWRRSEAAEVELIFDSTRRDTEIPLRRVRGVLQGYSATAGKLRLLSRGVDTQLDSAVLVTSRDLATPEARSSQFLAFMLPYFLILSAFLGGAAIVIDSTAGERERQSLEPLLATPAAREAIMSGKILASTVFGMISLVLLIVALKLTFVFAEGKLGGNLDTAAALGVLLVLVPMVLLGTCLLTLISASVKSVKEAQSYMSVLMLMPLIPTIVLMVNPVKDQLWQFTVPFLAQNQLIIRLVRGEAISVLEWSTYLGSSLAICGVLWVLAARLYHKEKLAISA
ncbi:ABC transporter permease [Pseudomarimonas salicorniae]|uniref:ABC transporter permease n=1 Tax=Pseudomarimonas salicorniae TaxID=2933270 RepID=A0ABT0GD38_9GAMM|nr:ABC transporter permease [Lysobacter sp. CAU 1642]MCK7592458.1 ABC transporter permease [Lysobacter sp. CAU 1642]